MMMYEISNVRQNPGDPRRRWFTGNKFDLYIFFDEDDKPLSFQLYYGDLGVLCREDGAMAQCQVKDMPRGFYASSAMVYSLRKTFDVYKVIPVFLDSSKNLPQELVNWVVDKLHQFKDPAPIAAHAFEQYISCIDAIFSLDAMDNDFFSASYIANDPRIKFLYGDCSFMLRDQLTQHFMKWCERNYPEIPTSTIRELISSNFEDDLLLNLDL